MKVKFEQEQNFDVSFEGMPKGDYSGVYFVTPSDQSQSLPTSGKTLVADIVIEPIPNNYGLITYDGSTITVS